MCLCVYFASEKKRRRQVTEKYCVKKLHRHTDVFSEKKITNVSEEK